jgi:hypothetical protein
LLTAKCQSSGNLPFQLTHRTLNVSVYAGHSIVTRILDKTQKHWPIRALGLICVLLVGFSGFAQAVHVHAENSKLSSHECSICAVAHAGVIASATYQPSPVFVRSVLFIAPDVIHQSSGFIFSLRIRPPPQA